jgi:hypothetical protein
MAKLTNPEPLPLEAQRAFEEIRRRHGLRALAEDENGTGVDGLPGGVYGFTYSAMETNFPLFSDRDLRSFETHKLTDGSVFLLGFLTPDETEAFEKTQSTTIHLFPEPHGAADRLVRVPALRVQSHVENSARKGTGLELRIGPRS